MKPPSQQSHIYDANGHISREMRGQRLIKNTSIISTGQANKSATNAVALPMINATQLCKNVLHYSVNDGRDFRPTIRSINPYCTYCKEKRMIEKSLWFISLLSLRFHFLRACRSTILGNESGCLKSIKLHSSSLSLFAEGCRSEWVQRVLRTGHCPNRLTRC